MLKNNKLASILSKNKEKLDGLYYVDSLMFVYLNMTSKMELTELQTKFRINNIYLDLKKKSIELNQQITGLRTLFEQQRFQVMVKIGLAECYGNITRIINNGVVSEKLKGYIEEFSSAIENNYPYDHHELNSFLNDLELRIKISEKFLKRLVKKL